ncbi:LysR family transcriptional regulator [Alloalcanivorax sp. C16-2]|uniref:LysR substrate-binding domain-containing protein n=1 Tax=Alloalcanivorax TaxID=3020832 RepID=UPI0019344078|nr:LysR family transcriptional regulator [Alloalcanivorax marinus]
MRGTEFAELQGFMAIVTHGSFVRGAESLNITPSALSQSMKALEARLGVQLLHRTTRRVRLTEAGERLAARLEPALGELSAALADASLLADRPRGKIRIHAMRLGSRLYLEPHLPEFLDEYPEIKVDVCVDDAAVDTVADGYDVSIRLGEMLDQDFVALPLGPPIRQIAAAAPDYLERFGHPASPADLRDHRCITWRWPGHLGCYQWEFFRNDRWLRVTLQGVLSFNDQRLALEAAVRGAGVAFWAEDQIKPYVARGELVPLLEDWSAPFEGFYLCFPKQNQKSSVLRCFIDFMKERSPSPRIG